MTTVFNTLLQGAAFWDATALISDAFPPGLRPGGRSPPCRATPMAPECLAAGRCARRLASVTCGSFLPQSASISSSAGGTPCPHTAGRMGASPFPASSSFQTEGILLTARVLTHGAPAVSEAQTPRSPPAATRITPLVAKSGLNLTSFSR